MKVYTLILILCFITIGSCKRNINMLFKRRNSKESSSISMEYYTKQSQNVNVNIMIHLDKVLTNKLMSEYKSKTRKKLKIISNEILKEVQNMFLHPSLNQKISFKLIDTRFLKNKTNVVTMGENGKDYLKSYCDWQAEKKTNSRKWYYSVLLTGLDLYYLNHDGKEVRSSTGRGYLGGMCAINKSCTILEWNPKNMGYLLTHEIAHSLAMTHDGPPHNRCRSQGHVMSAKYNPGHLPNSWSSCNRQELRRYLLSKRSWCLRGEHDKNISRGY